MSIVRVGMSEDDKFGAGYDAIFGTKGNSAKKPVAKVKKGGAKATAKKGAKKKGSKRK